MSVNTREGICRGLMEIHLIIKQAFAESVVGLVTAMLALVNDGQFRLGDIGDELFIRVARRRQIHPEAQSKPFVLWQAKRRAGSAIAHKTIKTRERKKESARKARIYFS